MKKLFVLLITVFILFTLVGCRKIVSNRADEINDSGNGISGSDVSDNIDEVSSSSESTIADNADEVSGSSEGSNRDNINEVSDSDEIETSYIYSDYAWNESFEELCLKATDVVRVEVLDQRVEWIDFTNAKYIKPQIYPDAGGEPIEIEPKLMTIYRLRVLEVFKGNAVVGDVLEAMQEGGQKDKTKVINKDRVSITSGDEVVVCLSERLENFPKNFINPYQSIYRLDSPGKSVMESRNTQERLEPVRAYIDVSEENDIKLTIGDLQDLAEKNTRDVKDNTRD